MNDHIKILLFNLQFCQISNTDISVNQRVIRTGIHGMILRWFVINTFVRYQKFDPKTFRAKKNISVLYKYIFLY